MGTFNPRPPHGGRPRQTGGIDHGKKLSIHALLTEGDPGGKAVAYTPGISIHALLTEGDQVLDHLFGAQKVISIHALLTEGDFHLAHLPVYKQYFNPRPPHGGRRNGGESAYDSKRISIHALLTEGDCGMIAGPPAPRYFNPRPPHGGRPQWRSTRCYLT